MITIILIYMLIYLLQYRFQKMTSINWFNNEVPFNNYDESAIKEDIEKFLYIAALIPFCFIITMIVYRTKYWTLKTIKPNQ